MKRTVSFKETHGWF